MFWLLHLSGCPRLAKCLCDVQGYVVNVFEGGEFVHAFGIDVTPVSGAVMSSGDGARFAKMSMGSAYAFDDDE